MEFPKSYVIGICGGSGSGKSYMVQHLKEHFPPQSIAVIDQDSYYNDLSHLSPKQRLEINFDHPNAIDFDHLSLDIEHIRTGRIIKKPIYNFTTHTRNKTGSTVLPSPIIIIEGHHIFHLKKIRAQVEHKVYLDIESDIRFIRRLVRDTKERGRSVENVIQQYLSTVRPMDRQFVQPVKLYADTVINSSNYQEMFSKIVRILKQFIK